MQFSLHCTKYNRHGYKARPRIFVITEKVTEDLLGVELLSLFISQGCYLLEPGNYKVKESFSFREIAGIFVSSLSDGVVIIKLQTDTLNRASC